MNAATESEVCAVCRKVTPEKYYGCTDPCNAYKAFMACVSADKVKETTKTSVELCRLNNERESLRSD